MNGKRVQFQKNVKTCNENLSKQPKKNIRTWNLVGMILNHFGTSFGHFLGSRRPSKSESERKPIFNSFLTDFGCLLGPLLGAMLRQNGPPKLSKVTFFDFFTVPKSMHFSKTFWEAFGALLRPSWDRFGRVLEAKIDANIDPDENVKIAFSPQRELKNQGLEGIEKAWKIDVKTTCQACSQEVPQNAPKVCQNGPKRVPRGLQKEVKMWLQL